MQKWYTPFLEQNTFIPVKGWNQIREFRERLYKHQDGKCFYCNIEMTQYGDNTGDEFCCEHLTPKSRGGEDHPDNIVGSCARCNTRKSNMTLDEYVAKLKDSGMLTAVLAGRIGGRKTMQKHGTEHFAKIARDKAKEAHDSDALTIKQFLSRSGKRSLETMTPEARKERARKAGLAKGKKKD